MRRRCSFLFENKKEPAPLRYCISVDHRKILRRWLEFFGSHLKEKAEANAILALGGEGSFFRRKANITCRQANFTVKQLHSPKANITVHERKESVICAGTIPSVAYGATSPC